MEPHRCVWSGTDPQKVAYQDQEWGVPVHDDRLLFEYLILEGAQAGLSWRTVLAKRAHYRRAFASFDPTAVARFDDAEAARLLADPGIVRNRLKIAAAIRNANAFLEVQREHGTFDAFIWPFVGGRPIDHQIETSADVPARTADSDAMSKDLTKRGFKFVGSTICYAFMQAVGMVNDHERRCFRHSEISSEGGGDNLPTDAHGGRRG